MLGMERLCPTETKTYQREQKMKKRFKQHILPAALALAAAQPAHAAQYSIQTLAKYIYSSTSTENHSFWPYVRGLNESGKAVGSGYATDLVTNPYFYQFGDVAAIYDHGTVTRPAMWSPTTGYYNTASCANAINDAGQATGYWRDAYPSYQMKAFIVNGNGADIQDLGHLGGFNASSYDINNAGQAVGTSNTANGLWHAALFDIRDGQRSVVDLDAIGGSNGGTAYGINNQGQVVGGTTFPGQTYHHAFLYANGTMTDLGNLGLSSSADAINDQGQVVGWYSDASAQRPFLYANGRMTDLGTLGGCCGQAIDVNNNGQTVGWAYTNTTSHAFIHANGAMQDLNNLLPANSGWVLHDARGINDKGQIVGQGYLNGVWAVFLLTPTLPTASAGLDATVKEGDAVTLNGSGSSAPGCTAATGCLSYTWKQIGGPAVTLGSTNPAKPGFTAPALPLGQKSDVLTFELVVKDDLFTSSPATVNITVQHVNVAPVAVVGVAQTVSEGSPVSLDGSASYDADGVATGANYLSFAWSNPALAGDACASLMLSDVAAPKPSFTAPAVGPVGLTCGFDLVVTDADGAASAKATASVTIENVNHAPTADAGVDQTVNEGDAPVTLNASASADPDGDALNYAWRQIGGTNIVTLSNANSAAPGFSAPQVGAANDTLVFELTVDDGLGLSSTAQTRVTVLDKSAPPACDKGTVKVEVDDFWPPNHKMKKVEIEGLGEDRERVASGSKRIDKDRDDVYVKILGVTQDEPTKGLDGSDASPDAAVVADEEHDRLLLRAERAQPGNGRVYQISYRATDKSGQFCEGKVTICAAPNKGKKAVCVDDGQKYDSFLK
jgi:probable HAF family extracellular repeat protein